MIVDWEFLVLLGLLGCGKMMMMWMIVGLEDFLDGEIWIGDCKVNDLELKDCDVVMVFQSYVFYFNFNVYENICFLLKVWGIDLLMYDEKVCCVSVMVELDEFLYCCFVELFGGQC